VGPDVRMMVDAVESWTLARARRTGRVLQDAGIAWLEDPGHHSDVAGLADLRGRLEVPIAAGEHLYHLDAFRTLLQARAVDVVILDLARVGGVTPWRKIAGLAQAHRIPVCGHVVPEIQVHLLTAVANGHMVEYVPRSAGILRAMPRIENGDLVAPQGPGLGRGLGEAAGRRHWVVERAMPGRFGGQVAIVTAGGSGIGAATARRFAGEGAAVVVADLSGTRAEAVASSITAAGRRAAAIKMDA